VTLLALQQHFKTQPRTPHASCSSSSEVEPDEIGISNSR